MVCGSSLWARKPSTKALIVKATGGGGWMDFYSPSAALKTPILDLQSYLALAANERALWEQSAGFSLQQAVKREDCEKFQSRE